MTMTQLQRYVERYGPVAGPKLYHALRSRAAYIGRNGITIPKPISRNSENWNNTRMPLASSATLDCLSLREESSRCTINWSVPWLAVVRKHPPSNPAQKVYVREKYCIEKLKSNEAK